MSKHMHKSTLSFVASSIAVVALGLILADPFDWTMNNMFLALLSGLLLASFGLFAGLFWQEKAADEREAVLVDKAGRLGYLAGLTVLIIGLVLQSFDHSVDAWLVIAITTMILSKQLYLLLKK